MNLFYTKLTGVLILSAG